MLKYMFYSCERIALDSVWTCF